MSSASQCPCVGGKGCHLYFTAGETEVWGSWKICLGTHNVSIPLWPGLTSLTDALTCSGWFSSCPLYTLTAVLPVALVALQVVITEITSSHLLYAIPLRVSPGKTYSLNYVTVSFCCKGACNCCSQRETISDLHQSITTALCYIHVSHFSLYCLFSLIFCLLGPCSRTKYWQIVLHLAPVLVEPFSVRAVSNCSLWLWKYHLWNFFSSPEVQSKENWKNCECLHGL